MIVELGRHSRDRLLAVARALDGRDRGVALLHGEGWGALTLAVDPIDERRIAFSERAFDEVESSLDALARPSPSRGWNGLRPAYEWIGYVAYEAARSLERPAWTRTPDARPAPIGAAMVMRRFGAVARRDPSSGVVSIEGSDRASVATLARAIADTPAIDLEIKPIVLTAEDSSELHAARIERVLSLIARGDLYQANVARAFSTTTAASATELLASLLHRTTARFAAAIDLGDHALASSSPELFLDVQGRRVLTSPIKGTRPRGREAEDDARLSEELAHDPKEQAELTMIVDLERNDLGRVASIGSVRAAGNPRLESSRTVHHVVRDVVAELRPEVGIGTLFRAAFPSGSVTGAPKIRAMEVIAELEASRRGLYCGAIVAIDRGGGVRASMAIRTLVVDRRSSIARYHAGGGIVEGSRVEREVAETEWKARQVLATTSRTSP